MATRVPTWLKVTGGGCAVFVMLVAAVGAGSFFFLRASIREFEAADCSLDELARRHGEIAGYRPDPGGGIGAERLEAFLAARDRVLPRRERVENALALLSGGDDPDRRDGVLPRLRGTVGLLRNLAPFHRERNEALMASEVGLGEYYYLYTLAYYSWLGKSPADGPPFKLVGENGYLLETIEHLEEPVVRDYRTRQARIGLNRLLLPVLRNQLADLGPRRDEDDLRAWRDTLASEVAALEADPKRLPWEDGLPPAVEESLRPYRDRLDDSYSTLCNAIEVGLARRTTDLSTPGAGGDAPES